MAKGELPTREEGIREAIAAVAQVRVRNSEKHVLWDVTVALRALLNHARAAREAQGDG